MKTEPTLAELREAFKEFQEKHINQETTAVENMMEEKRRKLMETIAMDASEYFILLDLTDFLARKEYDETIEI